MDINRAQREMRSAFLGGFMGQMVSAVLGLLSGLLSVWVSPRAAITFVWSSSNSLIT